MPRIKLTPLNKETFTRFGDLISTDFARKVYPINAGTTTRFHDIANIDVTTQNGRCIVNIFRAQPCTLPITIKMMERHPLASQAFIPRDMECSYLVVVAPVGDLDESQITAFLAQEGMGVNYAKGVWHHPLLALDKESDFIVLDRGGEGSNCDEQILKQSLTLSL